LASATGEKTFSFGYDNSGNTTAENARQYNYNQNQRLTQVTENSTVLGDYVYNAKGQRVKKTVNELTTIFHFDQSGLMIVESTSAGTITAEYAYLNGQPLTKIENNNVYYYHNDHLGTPIVMTDSSGSIVWQGEFKPFGEPVSITGSITNNLRFPGQYYDSETGLHQNWYRDYKTEMGRYAEADPIGIKKGTNHIYVYVGNNPINFEDSLGLYGTNDCSRYTLRCAQSGGEYYCETAPKYCNWFPKYPDPDPNTDDDFEGWSRCTRQCLQDCDNDLNHDQSQCPNEPDSTTDEFTDSKNQICHVYCYTICGGQKITHPLTP